MELNLFLELMKDADPLMEYEIERMVRDVSTMGEEDFVNRYFSIDEKTRSALERILAKPQ